MSHFTFITKAAALMCAACLLFPLAGLAEEPTYFIPSYQEGEELDGVRAWEESWAGKKITAQNLEEIKEFLPESFYNIMNDTERWGESWFEILPYQQIPPTPGSLKFTKEYYGQAKIGSEGELLDWVSGVPFPDTGDAVKLAYNFRTKSFGDAYTSQQSAFAIDGRLKYDMDVRLNVTVPFFAGRTDTPPVPEVENNPKNIWRALSMLQQDPPETRDLRILELHYKDRTKPYDRWMWIPQLRRVKRSSTTERQDPKGPVEWAGYDNQGWDGPVRENTYKYLGARDLLLARHTDHSKLVHTPGDCLFDGLQRERVKMHVLEAIHEDPNFFYSKMIWYIDPETWLMLYSDRYDRRGRLWKTLENFGGVYKGYEGVDVTYFATNQAIDVQRMHSTLAIGETTYGISVDQRAFTPGALAKSGR